jgi:uncharacterized membrane protein
MIPDMIYYTFFMAAVIVIVILFIFLYLIPRFLPEVEENRKKMNLFYSKHSDWRVRRLYNCGFLPFVVLAFVISFFKIPFLWVIAIQQLNFYALTRLTRSQNHLKKFKDFDEKGTLVGFAIIFSLALIITVMDHYLRYKNGF